MGIRRIWVINSLTVHLLLRPHLRTITNNQWHKLRLAVVEIGEADPFSPGPDAGTLKSTLNILFVYLVQEYIA